jgi:hypothetical protein
MDRKCIAGLVVLGIEERYTYQAPLAFQIMNQESQVPPALVANTVSVAWIVSQGLTIINHRMSRITRASLMRNYGGNKRSWRDGTAYFQGIYTRRTDWERVSLIRDEGGVYFRDPDLGM